MRAIQQVLSAAVLMVSCAALTAAVQQPASALPNKNGSLKFLIIGDTRSGDRPQYEVAQAMQALRPAWRYDNILMLGDNIFGAQRPSDYLRKFEKPYAALLSDGVTFRAALGDEDQREQRLYKHFNMEGKAYYTWKPPQQDVRFF